MKKVLFLDLETTGKNHLIHGIHQIAGILDLDGNDVKVFNYRVTPHPTSVIEPDALKISNVTADEIKRYQNPDIVMKHMFGYFTSFKDFGNPQDKIFLAGYNASAFDRPFYKKFFDQNNYGRYFSELFHTGTLDVMVMCAEYSYITGHVFRSYELSNVASELGIPLNKELLHDAGYDNHLTRQIFYKIKTTIYA